MSNATPPDGGDDSVQVASNVPATSVSATIYYETTTSQYSATTDASGSATIPFGIGQATVGDTVTVTVIVGSGTMCSTSFTPS